MKEDNIWIFLLCQVFQERSAEMDIVSCSLTPGKDARLKTNAQKKLKTKQNENEWES